MPIPKDTRNPTTVMSEHFFYYDAVNLAIDPERPWQLLTRHCCVIGKFSTKEKAQVALDALEADWGNLPNNLSKWSKHDLLVD